MRLGFVSDAHGNPEGLYVCLEFLRKQAVDKIFFLGDAVGYMPDWAGVFSLLAEYEVKCLQGNHDYMAFSNVVCGKKNQIYNLNPELIEANMLNLSRAAACPSSLSVDVGEKRLLLVHGSPWQPLDGYIYPDSPVDQFEFVEANSVFMGHTHRPFIRRSFGKRLVNVGSCGLPRDVGNLASCSIFDSEQDICDVYRIPFNVEKIIEVYGQELHSSVVNCLRRRADSYFGILIA